MGGRRWMLMKHGARAPRRSVGGGRRGGPLRAFAVPCASASWSEHLLSSTLTLAAVAAWLVFARTRDAWTRLAALLLVPAVAMTRPEAIVHVALVPLWTLWRDFVARRGMSTLVAVPRRAVTTHCIAQRKAGMTCAPKSSIERITAAG